MEKIKKIWNKFVNRETILYGIFGVLTTLENIFLFKLLLKTSLPYTVANLITIITVKLTAYICNKNFVFESRCKNFVGLLKEFVRFVIARGATALIDYFGLILLVEVIKLPKLESKIIVTVLVIIINYIVGKKAVFKDSKSKEKEDDTQNESSDGKAEQ